MMRVDQDSRDETDFKFLTEITDFLKFKNPILIYFPHQSERTNKKTIRTAYSAITIVKS